MYHNNCIRVGSRRMQTFPLYDTVLHVSLRLCMPMRVHKRIIGYDSTRKRRRRRRETPATARDS